MARQFTSLLKTALPELTDADLEKVRTAYQSKHGRYQADMAIGTMPNLVASLVANRFDMHGPAYTVDAACASGIVAINHSISLLRSGECEVAVAGGMHAGHSAMFWGAFDMLGAMSRKQQIAPFSKNADGLLVGQGGGFVVLKKLRKALDDGDRIYALIKETAVSSDGAGSHVTVTNVEGQVRVLEKAWGKSGMDPKTLGYIEAHGTATPVGDKIEITTLRRFFGDRSAPPAFVGSIKSNIGHTMPAAGMIGVIKTALSLYHRKIPPTLHCEEPLADMFESRFLPPQEPIDWDEDKYPLVAGVNAFGFGGINSHAILTAYVPEPGAPALPRPRPYLGEALRISAENQAALIRKLKTGDFTDTGGNYRLVLFDPSDDRIEKALAIVEKDKPWRGRLNIWFSNQLLLGAGGKIACIFPGWTMEPYTETDSLSESLDLPFMKDLIAQRDEGTEDSRAALSVHYTEWLSMRALEKLGIETDLYAGHSIGEWNATMFAGITDGDFNDLRQGLNEFETPQTYPLLAVGGIDREIAENWCKAIPDLYLANDNCPSQVLLTGKEPAIARLRRLLEQEQKYYTELPFGWGTHTPLMEQDLDPHRTFLQNVHIKEGKVPVWSCTTLEPVPTEKEAYIELVGSQMTRPVYFRGLTEKLYQQEQVRMFIQIGTGSLTSFVEETLKDRDFACIATNVAGRDAADQMRRVMALLYIEGRTVDPGFLGVKPLYQVDHNLMILPRGAPPILTDLPELREVMRERYGAAGPGAALDPGEGGGNPLLHMANDNMRSALRVQNELVRLFQNRKEPPRSGVPAKAPARESEKAAASPVKEQPESFTETMRLTLEDHPYLVDHSIIRQPAGWPYDEDLNPVVPFTMTIELLAELAQKHASGRKLLRIGKVGAFRWIGLEKPFEEKITGVWKGPDLLVLELGNYAKAEFTFGEEWLPRPDEYAGSIDIGDEIVPAHPSAFFYDKYAFHGPQYHSATKTLKIAARGMTNLAEKMAGKGSLLDIMGQQLGLFLHLTQTENTISFPVRLKELVFFSDIFDQAGVFEHTLIITKLTSSAVVGNMVLKRDGKIWCVAREFVCQRFVNYLPVWNVILKPQFNLLAEEIAPGVFYYENTNQDNILGLLVKRYLNSADREYLESRESASYLREYLVSRIALKDGVRKYISPDASAEMPYPIEIFCGHDERGRPTVRGEGRAEGRTDRLQVSLSHKGKEAVAIVAEKPVGIDLEKIEEKPESFLDAAFSHEERILLNKLDQPENVIRFWVAKEACAKKDGGGLQGNPKRFVVSAVDGDRLQVNGEWVQTMKVNEEYIAGWTI
jgi:3-oxoacyl-(acyl-carrier-protein) synthase/malonyl CoA-acyl carrier protein transacylase/phosphopantetheinyl transferase